MTDDLAPEQRLMVQVLRANGTPTDQAEAIVRSERVFAYKLGSHLMPVIEEFMVRLTALAESLGVTLEGGGAPPGAGAEGP